jgi:hypothetical protein
VPSINRALREQGYEQQAHILSARRTCSSPQNVFVMFFGQRVCVQPKYQTSCNMHCRHPRKEGLEKNFLNIIKVDAGFFLGKKECASLQVEII